MAFGNNAVFILHLLSKRFPPCTAYVQPLPQSRLQIWPRSLFWVLLLQCRFLVLVIVVVVVVILQCYFQYSFALAFESR
jgi:hypothetical protein